MEEALRETSFRGGLVPSRLRYFDGRRERGTAGEAMQPTHAPGQGQPLSFCLDSLTFFFKKPHSLLSFACARTSFSSGCPPLWTKNTIHQCSRPSFRLRVLFAAPSLPPPHSAHTPSPACALPQFPSFLFPLFRVSLTFGQHRA